VTAATRRIGAGLVAVVLAGVPAHATEPKSVPTKLTIRYNSSRYVFHGVAGSKNKRCRRDRSVTLFKERPGGAVERGSASTNRRGEWRIATGSPAHGDFYARVASAQVTTADGETRNCLPDQSRTIHVTRK
jgi:hypothetical protein